MCKISVIIPVYNAEKTLKKCVDSIISGSFSDFEILLINDGSADKSIDICNAYSAEDSRIKTFDNKNGGAAYSRNFGMSKANGKYFCFVDSDDYIDKNALLSMYEKAEKENADILMCGYIMENDNCFSNISAKSGTYTGTEINERIVEIKSKNLIDSPCNKLYNSDFVKKSGVIMPENETFEDTDFNLRLLTFSPKFVIMEECFYHYILRMGSTTRRYNKDKLPIIKKRAILLSEVTQGVEKYCDFYYIKSVFSAFIDAFLSLRRKEIIKLIKDEIKTDIFIKKSKNAEFSGVSSKIITLVAKSGNVNLIYLFCKLSYILKYKFQKLFLRVR